MPSDRAAEPWAGATYNGFSGPQGASRPVDPPRQGGAHRPRADRKVVIGGLAAAIAAGLLFGWMARSPVQTLAPEPAAESSIARVPVEVVKPPPPAPVRSDGPLEVLPADLAEAAEAARPVAPAPRATASRAPAAQAPAPEAPAPRPPAVSRSVAPAPPTPRAPVQQAPTRPAPVVAEAPRRVAPGFNCAYARSRSERMVCADSELAGLDRRLNRAFDRAVSSGIPFRALRAEQDDWLNIREDAARHSPDAVASVYRQRISELNAIAEDGGY